MKKILIAFSAVASAMVVNAAACTWSTTGTIYNPVGSSAAVAGFTAYLFDTTTISQSALIEALRDGGSITEYTAMSTYSTPTAAKVASTSFEQDSGKTINAYFVIVQDDYVYISNQKSGTTSDVGATPFAFASQSTISKNIFDSTTAYSSAGWYSTAVSPGADLRLADASRYGRLGTSPPSRLIGQSDKEKRKPSSFEGGFCLRQLRSKAR